MPPLLGWGYGRKIELPPSLWLTVTDYKSKSSVGDHTTVDFTSSINLGKSKLSLCIGILFGKQYASVRQQTFSSAFTQIAAAPRHTCQIHYSASF